MQNKQNTIYTIIGHKGFGKTTLTEILTLMNNKPAIMVDPCGQFISEHKRRKIFHSFGEFRAWIYNRKNLNIFYEGKLELVVREPNDEEFDEICLISRKIGKHTLVVDEADLYAPPSITKNKPFYKLVNMGRHSEVDIITTSRRPARISRDITSQTDVVFFARVLEPNDKDYIKKYIGEQHIKTAETLKKYSFLMIDQEREPHLIKVSKKSAELIS